MKPSDILRRILDIFKGYLESSAFGYVEMELVEKKNLFGLLVFSPLAGLPLVPAGLSLELLPYMEEHVAVALRRLSDLDDGLGLAAGRFDIE